jgi:hypothetical protein
MKRNYSTILVDHITVMAQWRALRPSQTASWSRPSLWVDMAGQAGEERPLQLVLENGD